jgi:ferredoxin-thioredoxin reductase catalytic subunit
MIEVKNLQVYCWKEKITFLNKLKQKKKLRDSEFKEKQTKLTRGLIKKVEELGKHYCVCVCI